MPDLPPCIVMPPLARNIARLWGCVERTLVLWPLTLTQLGGLKLSERGAF